MKTSPFIHRQVILTRNFKGQPCWVLRIGLDRKEKTRARRLAAAFNFSLVEFLTRFFSHALPGQIFEEDARIDVDPEQFRLVTLDPELERRLKRAAAFEIKSPGEFVAEAITSWIAGAEEQMLLHPATGNVLACHEELRGWVRSEDGIGLNATKSGSQGAEPRD